MDTRSPVAAPLLAVTAVLVLLGSALAASYTRTAQVCAENESPAENEPAAMFEYDSTGLRLDQIYGWTCVHYRDGQEVSGYSIGWWG